MVSRWRRFKSNDLDLPLDGQEAQVRTAAEADPQVPTGAPDATCGEPQERSLLLLYSLSACMDDEALDFEAHLLGCEACFEDLKALDRARSVVQESLAADPTVLQRVRRALGSFRRSLGLSSAPPQRLP